MAKTTPSCAVIGAGVVGLSTALCLQEKGYRVTIIAERFGADTTSFVAGGIFLPYNRNVLGSDRRDDAVEVAKRSWRHYKRLHEQSSEHMGVMKSFGYQCYFTKEYKEQLPDEPLVWEVVDKFRSLSVEELMKLSPHTPCSGWLIQTYIIQCQYYLKYLAKRLKHGGATFIQKRLKSFDELPPFDCIVNCCGIGAVAMCGDDSVFPAQGQVAHALAPHVKHFFHCEEVYEKSPEDRQLLYMLPQTHHVILGGTYTDYSDVTLVDEAVRDNFIRKLCHAAPSLQNCEIIKEQCGVRPARNRLRLESEKVTLNNGRILKVVHNYGHGGNGIALSWGTAEMAAEIVERMCRPTYSAKL